MTSVCIDLGSGKIKCGFSGSKIPDFVFPSIIGRFKHHGILPSMTDKYFVGEEAQEKRGILKLKYPIEHGMICNWSDLQKILEYSLKKKLKVEDGDECHLLLTRAPLSPENNRKKMIGLVFEKFDISSFYYCQNSVLTLFSYGKVSGLVLESGEGVTHTVPIVDGCNAISKDRISSGGGTILRLNLGGRDCTDYLSKILCERGYEMYTSQHRLNTKIVKEKSCFVSLDREKEYQLFEESAHCEKTYTLPDNSEMTIGSERFRAPEIMFSPHFIGSSIQGISEQTYQSIMRCKGQKIQKLMFENIVLGGGNTMFNGMKERIQQDISEMFFYSDPQKVNVEANKNRMYSSWIGGSIISSLSSFKDKYITKKDYEEYGKEIIRRCNCEKGDNGSLEFITPELLKQVFQPKDSDMMERISDLMMMICEEEYGVPISCLMLFKDWKITLPKSFFI